MRTSSVLGLAAFTALVNAQSYVLEDDYTSDNFFSMFDFFTVGTQASAWFRGADFMIGSGSNEWIRDIP